MRKKRLAPVGRTALTAEERTQVWRLADQCNAHERLDLKLVLDQPPDQTPGSPSAFLLFSDDGEVAGFCSLDGTSDVEVCGMVRPDWRRRGLGAALLAAARRACVARGARRLLLICEDASQSGRAFVARQQGQLRFSELRMTLDRLPLATLSERSRIVDGLALRPVTAADRPGVETFVRVCAAAFDDELDEARRFVADGLRYANERYYVAVLDGVAVGCLKLVYVGAAAGVYAFGVSPERRHRGLGKRMLAHAAAIGQERGCTRMWLEVEADNTPALALYRASGFRETTTYGYYEVPLVATERSAKPRG